MAESKGVNNVASPGNSHDAGLSVATLFTDSSMNTFLTKPADTSDFQKKIVMLSKNGELRLITPETTNTNRVALEDCPSGLPPKRRRHSNEPGDGCTKMSAGKALTNAEKCITVPGTGTRSENSDETKFVGLVTRVETASDENMKNTEDSALKPDPDDGPHPVTRAYERAEIRAINPALNFKPISMVTTKTSNYPHLMKPTPAKKMDPVKPAHCSEPRIKSSVSCKVISDSKSVAQLMNYLNTKQDFRSENSSDIKYQTPINLSNSHYDALTNRLSIGLDVNQFPESVQRLMIAGKVKVALQFRDSKAKSEDVSDTKSGQNNTRKVTVVTPNIGTAIDKDPKNSFSKNSSGLACSERSGDAYSLKELATVRECVVCGEKFRTASDFEQHHSSHTKINERRSRCSVCNEVVSIGHENAHFVLQHQGGVVETEPCTQWYSCQICNSNLSTKRQWLIHMLTHFQSRGSYQCQICEKRFAAPGLLFDHLLNSYTINNEHECPHCCTGYAVPHAYRSHLRRCQSNKGENSVDILCNHSLLDTRDHLESCQFCQHFCYMKTVKSESLMIPAEEIESEIPDCQSETENSPSPVCYKCHECQSHFYSLQDIVVHFEEPVCSKNEVQNPADENAIRTIILKRPKRDTAKREIKWLEVNSADNPNGDDGTQTPEEFGNPSMSSDENEPFDPEPNLPVVPKRLLKPMQPVLVSNPLLKGQYICSSCPQRFLQQSELKQHMRETHKLPCDNCNLPCYMESWEEYEKPYHEEYHCDTCGELCSTMRERCRHILLTHKSSLKDMAICDDCGKRVECLEEHKQRDHARKRYQCADCGHVSFGATLFKVHSEKHALQSEKTMPCEYCAQLFKFRAALMRHLRRSCKMNPNRTT